MTMDTVIQDATVFPESSCSSRCQLMPSVSRFVMVTSCLALQLSLLCNLAVQHASTLISVCYG